MAKKTVTRATKKSEPPTIPSAKVEEAPVSAEIRRAAERIGIPPEYWAEQERKRRFGEETKLTFTLHELCDAVGFDVHPESFAADSLERIAQQVEAESGLNSKAPNDDDAWHRLQSIVDRAKFAARVVRKLQETAVAS